jgi:hypothetical protein
MGLLVKMAVDHDILLGLAGVNDDNHGRAALLLVHVVLEARDLLLSNGRSLYRSTFFLFLKLGIQMPSPWKDFAYLSVSKIQDKVDGLFNESIAKVLGVESRCEVGDLDEFLRRRRIMSHQASHLPCSG